MRGKRGTLVKKVGQGGVPVLGCKKTPNGCEAGYNSFYR